MRFIVFEEGKVWLDTDYKWELGDMLHLTKADEKDDWFYSYWEQREEREREEQNPWLWKCNNV